MTDIPIGFFLYSPYVSHHVVRIVPPSEGDTYAIRGIWMAMEPRSWIVASIRAVFDEGTKPLLPGPVDASSFNADPRQDGLLRCVDLPMGEITSVRSLEIRFEVAVLTSCIPDIVGHAVARWVRRDAAP